MPANASIVLALVKNDFPLVADISKVSREDYKLAAQIKLLLLSHCNEDVQVEVNEEDETIIINDDQDDNYEPVEDDFTINSSCDESEPNKVRFSGGRLVAIEQVQKALKHYRSASANYRSLSSMQKTYRFIQKVSWYLVFLAFSFAKKFRTLI